MTGSSEQPADPLPRGLVGAMIAAPVHCCRCTYDLRGLSADGRCPECGLEIHYTLQHLVDPAASRLPKLRDPVGVGNAVAWLVFCCLSAGVLLAAQTVLVELELVHPTQLGRWGTSLAHDLMFLAGIFALAGLWSVYKFNPRSTSEHNRAVRIDLWLLAAGLAAWGVLGLLLWQRERQWVFTAIAREDVLVMRIGIHLGMSAASIMVWIGLERVLATIGRRSRAFRRAQGGRQNIRPMIVATIGVGIGSSLRLLGSLLDNLQTLAMLGAVILWVCMLMILIGLVYLQINAWWIRQALRHPPPRLENLLRRY